MSQIRLKDWLDVVGMTAIVASLIFVGMQIRQDRQIAIVETLGNVHGAQLQLAEIIQGRSELWQRALDGEELTVEEDIEFFALATAVERTFLIAYRRAKALGVYEPEAELRDYAWAIHCHKGLRRYFDSVRQRYEHVDAVFDVPTVQTGFSATIFKMLEYLEENSVPLPTEKVYVFWN